MKLSVRLLGLTVILQMEAKHTETSMLLMLKLSQARHLILDSEKGKFFARGWRDDVSRYLLTAIEILDDPHVEELNHPSYRKLWRTLAIRHRENPNRYGYTSILHHIKAFRRTVDWLAIERHIKSSHGLLPEQKWKDEFDRDWREITGKAVPEPKRLAYSREEFSRLKRALGDAEPRLRLAFILGASYDFERLRRIQRSHIKPSKEHPLGQVWLPGITRRQPGELVTLTEEQREALREAMETGYLSTLEIALVTEEIDDYRLITGGHLIPKNDWVNGKVQVRARNSALSPRVMRTAFDQLEELAGVEHKDGRGWGGLRRRVAEDSAQPASRRSAILTGWPTVDRQIDKAYEQLERAVTELEFQTVGVVLREAIISLAKAVFDPTRHNIAGEQLPGPADAKKMLEGYVVNELRGRAHKVQRHHAKDALDLANDLQHSRNANYREAALCVEATTSLINTVAIIAGRRLRKLS